MEKYLIVKGCAGLGNRIYTLSNAINFALKTNRTIYVDWADGQFDEKEQNAFYRFFNLQGIKYLDNINDIKNINSKSVYPKAWENIIHKHLYENFEQSSIQSLSFLPDRLNQYSKKMNMRSGYFISKTNKSKSDLYNLFSPKNFELGGSYKKDFKQEIVVFVDFSPKYYSSIIKDTININDGIKEKIRAFSSLHQLKHNFIGVHIRYTDKKPDSSFDKLYRAIERNYNNDTKMFLSTDNLNIQEMMQNRYSNIVVYPKYLPKKQEEGLHQWALYNNEEKLKQKLFEESIIDMWLLAECEHLIYQANSSFSGISRILKQDKNCTPW